MIKKIGSSHFSHMLAIIEEFEHEGNKFIITEYAETNLLKLQYERPNSVIILKDSLRYIARIV